jgi:uncharacterized SAM-binding protein YcdF (DUF218 family)
VISVLPISAFLVHSLEIDYPPVHKLPAHVDGIVVLNGLDPGRTESVGELTLYKDEAECFLEFVLLAHRYPRARSIYAVGDGLSAVGTEVLQDYFRQWDLYEVQIEDRSKRTADRVPALKRLAQPGPSETWLLVTPAERAERNLIAFREVGWSPVPIPVGHHHFVLKFNNFTLADSLNDLWDVMKEWVGTTIYKLFPVIRG